MTNLSGVRSSRDTEPSTDRIVGYSCFPWRGKTLGIIRDIPCMDRLQEPMLEALTREQFEVQDYTAG